MVLPVGWSRAFSPVVIGPVGGARTGRDGGRGEALERLEVTPIEAEHQPFDPNLHEAISQQESSDHPPGTVLVVLQRGYKAGDRLLRPSLVVVAKAKAG